VTAAATMPTPEFNFLHVPCGYPQPHFDDLRYEALKTSPPAGCAPQDWTIRSAMPARGPRAAGRGCRGVR
jgi:hypothetical protein